MYFPVLTDFSIFLVSILPGAKRSQGLFGFLGKGIFTTPAISGIQ